jgi:hypothetical protein
MPPREWHPTGDELRSCDPFCMSEELNEKAPEDSGASW